MRYFGSWLSDAIVQVKERLSDAPGAHGLTLVMASLAPALVGSAAGAAAMRELRRQAGEPRRFPVTTVH